MLIMEFSDMEAGSGERDSDVPALPYWRRKRGLTQRQLGDMIECSGGAVARYESGERGVKVPVLKKMAHALEVSEDDLLSLPPAEAQANG